MGTHLGSYASPTTPTVLDLPHLPRDWLSSSNRLPVALWTIFT